MSNELRIGDKVLLPGGEAGTVYRIINDHDLPEPLCIVALSQPRSNGVKVDTALVSELELVVDKPKIEWVVSVCPICGTTYPHRSNYQPKTCSKMDCLQKGMIKGLFS